MGLSEHFGRRSPRSAAVASAAIATVEVGWGGGIRWGDDIRSLFPSRFGHRVEFTGRDEFRAIKIEGRFGRTSFVRNPTFRWFDRSRSAAGAQNDSDGRRFRRYVARVQMSRHSVTPYATTRRRRRFRRHPLRQCRHPNRFRRWRYSISIFGGSATRGGVILPVSRDARPMLKISINTKFNAHIEFL